MSMLSIPVYIRLLGTAEWGVAAACVSLQLVANFIDAGFSQIVPRWVAGAAGDGVILRRYLVLFRRIYVGLGVLVLAVLQLGASPLAHHWFQVAPERAEALETAIRLISFQILFQFVNNLNIGFWHGLQLQVLANVRTCAFGTLKHLLTMLTLFVTVPLAWVYALVFAMVALIEVLVNFMALQRMVGAGGFQEEPLRPAMASFFREVSLLSGGILVGLIVSQLDRVILSRTVAVEQFGVYTVVTTLALAFLQLQTPLTRAYFPLLVQDIKTQGRVSSWHLRRLMTGTFVAATLPAIFAAIFATPLLQFWLRDSRFVEIGELPLRLLLLAVAANTIYGCLYQVIVAAGKAYLVFKFNLIALVVAGIVVLIMGASTGLVLGGVIWLATTLTQLMLGMSWFYLQRKDSRAVQGEGA